MNKRKLVPFFIAFAIIAFAAWWTTGLHFEKRPTTEDLRGGK